MRLGWIAGLALVAALAWWLVRTGSGGDALRPVAPGVRVEPGGRGPDDLADVARVAGARSEASAPAVAAEDSAIDEPLDGEPPVARLTIHAFLPDGRPWADGRLQLSAVASPLDEPVRLASGRSLRASGVVYQTSSSAGHRLALSADEHGEVVIAPVRPDNLMRLEASDAIGTVAGAVDGIVLGPGEQRGVELRLGRHPRTLRGRCIDELGRVLAGARVSVRTDERGQVLDSLEDGTFTLGPFFTPEVTVRAALDELIAVQTVAVPPDGALVDVVLRPGRRVVVDAVDADGAPVTNVGLSAHDLGREAPLDHSYARSGNSQVLTLLPHRPLELRWGSPCAPRSQTIDAAAERVTIVAERPGTLAVEVGTLPGGLEAVYAVEVRCADGVTQAASARGIQNTGHQQLEWRLFPGRHHLQLLHLPASEGAAWQDWGAPVPVDVFPGDTTVARLGG